MLTHLFQHYEMGWYFFFEGAFLFPFHTTDKVKGFSLSSIMAIPVVEFLREGSKLERFLVKFIYFEKATKFCEISTLDLSYVVPVKSTVEISQNFVAFSEYMNFKNQL